MNLQIHTIGLSIYRMILSFLVLKNVIFYFPYADDLFGKDAIVPYDVFIGTLMGHGLPELAYPFHLEFAPAFFLIGIGILAFMFFFGIGKHLTGFLLFICLMILAMRTNFILDGSDNVISVTLPFLALGSAYEYFTFKPTRSFSLKWPLLTRLSKQIAPYRKVLAHVLFVGLLVQVCFVYFFTSIAKLQGDLWLNGTAVYYTMRVEEFRHTGWNVLLTSSHYFVVLATYFTVLWELSFAFLVWFKQTRYYVLAGGLLLHLGIWYFMRIDNFSWIMIGTYFVFIPNHAYLRIQDTYLKKGILHIFLTKHLSFLSNPDLPEKQAIHPHS